MIGVIVPSAFEYGVLKNLKLKPPRAVLVTSGMGKLRAQAACFGLLLRYPGLRAILLVGFAGALSPSLRVGDVIEPSLFIEQDYNAEPFEKFPNKLKARSPKLFRDSKDATLLTQDRFLKENPYHGTVYARRFRNLACDMEAYAAAHFCSHFKKELAVVKIISDCADDSADHDFLAACRKLAPKLRSTVTRAIGRLEERLRTL